MKLKTLLLGAALAIMAGCGGGGGGSIGGPGQASMATFAADSVNDDFDHVWVTIHKVSAHGADDAVLMDDSAGRLVDLKTLHDASGARYILLDDRSIKAGDYDSVRVELDEDVMLVPKGSSSGTVHKFAEDHAGTAGRSVLNLPTRLTASGRGSVVIDFDLATWSLDGAGRVRANLRRGDGRGLEDRRRHEQEDFHGNIASLSGTSPNFTFTLTRGAASLTVKTDATTKIFNNSGAPNPQLANGQRVELAGVFVAGSLLASRVKIEDEAGEDPQMAKGIASNLNATAGTLNLKVIHARGFVPDRTTYSVVTSAATRFQANTGAIVTQAEFFAALTALGTGAQVEVEGTVQGGTFTAAKLKIENEHEANEAEIKGSVSALDANLGTLKVTVSSWEGVSLSVGASISVETVGATSYRLGNTAVDRAAFFAGIGVGSKVEAKGSLVGTTLTAIRLKTDN